MKLSLHQSWPFWAIATIVVLGSVACQREVASWRVVDVSVKLPTIPADGVSVDTVFARLPGNADSANSVVLFQTATGKFSNGSDTMSVLADINTNPTGKLTAYALLTSSLRAGLDTIWVTTNTAPPVTNSMTFTLTPSVANSIVLQASAFTVPANFGGEITLTGTLYNQSGNPVSMGTPVNFSDAYNITPPTAVGGSWRAENNLSDSNSQVSVIYTPGLVNTTDLANGQSFIWVTVSLTNPGNAQTPSSSVKLYVSQ